MSEQQWQRPVAPRSRVRWVLAAVLAVVGVALFAQVEAEETPGLEVAAREDDEATPTPESDEDGTAEDADDDPDEPDAATNGRLDAGGAWRALAVEDTTERAGTTLVVGDDEAYLWGGERREVEADVLARRRFYNTGIVLSLADEAVADLPHAEILEPRTGHVAVWTGAELLVWGGMGRSHHLSDGARYDPAAGTWTPMARAPLAPRANAAAVWTGEEVLIVGGTDNAGALHDGAAYAPASDEWRVLADAPRPLAPHRAHLGVDPAVWTGERLVVPAPRLPEPEVGLLAYDPAADAWDELPEPPMVRQQPLEIALVTADDGRLFAVGKGPRRRPYVAVHADGGWEDLPEAPGNGFWPDHWQPTALATWTAHGLAVVAGGEHGLLLDPDAGSWQELPPSPLPELWSAQVTWTGAGLLVWPERPPFAGPDGPLDEEPLGAVVWQPEAG